MTADENGDYKVINAKKLQAFFQFTVVTIAPVDLDNQVYTDFGYANDFAKIAAALGMVSVIPEKTGYGEASDLIMSPFVKTSLTTSTLPLFEKAKAIVKEMSDGKAKLADEVYFQGYVHYKFLICNDMNNADEVICICSPQSMRALLQKGFLRVDTVLSLQLMVSTKMESKC